MWPNITIMYFFVMVACTIFYGFGLKRNGSYSICIFTSLELLIFINLLILKCNDLLQFIWTLYCKHKNIVKDKTKIL